MANQRPVDLRQIANSSSINKEFKGAVALAAKHGWTGRFTGSGGIQMQSPDGKARSYVPGSIRDGGTAAKKIIHDIEKWAAQHERESIEASLVKIAEGVGLERDDIDAQHGPSPTIRCKEHDVEFLSWEGLSEHVRTVHTTHEDPVSKAILEAQEEESVETEAKPEIHDEFEEWLDEGEALTQAQSSAASTSATMGDEKVSHWLAIHTRNLDGTVNLYESEAVLEVSQGGSTFYRCALEGCGYEAARPRSVAMHYGSHVRLGEAEKVTEERVPVQTGVRIIEPGARRVLSREIYVAMRASRNASRVLGMSAYADHLADKIISNRTVEGVDTTDATQVVEGSAGDLIEQIRNLLGASKNDEEIAALNEALAVEKSAREKAERLAESRADTLRALASLAKEETG